MTYDNQPLKGELLSAQDEKLLLAIDKTKQQGISAQVAARIGKSVFFNKITEKRIRAAQAVVDAENNFMGSLITHQKTRNRLLNLGTELEADNLEQKNRLAAAKRQADLNELDDQIAREERLQRLEQLKRAREGTSENSRQQRNDRQYEDAQQQVAHDIRMKALDATKRLEMTRALRQERDRMIAEITAESRDTPNAEQEREIENIRDFFQRLIDEI